ncbi:MAG: type II toxin-antitoxin system RelB/DinJ family antitoxin [Bacilli bacterium]|nr:type II toxin-antitoxin system RelB/DinJ family antitoxin [Bacilli bacterium]
MESLTSGVINVHVDPKDKEEATTILKDLGLNMTTLINMTLKQVIKRKAVPFEISAPLFSDELEESLKETIAIEKEYKTGKRKGYNSANEMMKSILND